jgi:gamma-glutamylcyclotransferase
VSLVWYFAYGSNMQRATFGGRRGIEPRRALAARAPGWRLVLDKPAVVLPSRGVASIVHAEGEEVLGVLYEITQAELAHVDLTEGVLIGSYDRVTILVVPLEGGAPTVEAYTLVSAKRRPGLRPSRQYMSLLLEGALEHGLPAWWVERLRAVPADDETVEERELRALLDEALVKVGKPRGQ